MTTMAKPAKSSTEVPQETFDLEERTANFGEEVIKFAKTIPQHAITVPLIKQLIRAATSIGANYGEANDAESRKDFRHKVGLCRKESKETKHWLRMIVAAEPKLREPCATLWQEAKELNLIFGAIRLRTTLPKKR
jgi:four helix bundle protein